MATIQITIHEVSDEISGLMIARLDEIGFTGFEEKENELLAYIEEENFSRESVKQLMESMDIRYDEHRLEPRNWNAVWESAFHPVTIADRSTGAPLVHIRAAFHPSPGTAAYELEINPKMSFGTGHHETTSLMMEAMHGLDLKGMRVVDFGTGTGILAILAEKMGAASILATDCDAWSMENARENISLNHCSRIELLQSDVFPADSQPDIILANINLNVIRENLPSIAKASHARTKMLFSGILKSNEYQLINELNKNKISTEEVLQKGQWILLKSFLND